MNIPTLFWKFYSRVRSDNEVSLWSSCKPCTDEFPELKNGYITGKRTVIFLPGEAEAVDWQHYADARAKSVVDHGTY